MTIKSGLYIVTTPIGNQGDITIRALDTLKNSTIILCEDTRISQKLLAKHDIKAKLQVYNDHSNDAQRSLICRYLDQGEIISLISDAGTPLISDPGYKLVRDMRQKGYFVEVVPGVSAVIAGLTISGLPTDSFLFTGFLPKTAESKAKIFRELLGIKATLIFFEAAPRLVDSLQVAFNIFGNREACVARELTKLYQEAKLAPLDELISFYQAKPAKGEIVLMISGQSPLGSPEIASEELQKELQLYLKHGLTAKSATEIAYTKFSDIYSKNEIYKIVNNMLYKP